VKRFLVSKKNSIMLSIGKTVGNIAIEAIKACDWVSNYKKL